MATGLGLRRAVLAQQPEILTIGQACLRCAISPSFRTISLSVSRLVDPCHGIQPAQTPPYGTKDSHTERICCVSLGGGRIELAGHLVEIYDLVEGVAYTLDTDY